MLHDNQFKIFNASAGSGKTFTLVKEFLAFLLAKSEPDAFRELLAITFTNKAANEMKERIIEKLKELADVNVTNNELEQLAKEINLKPEVVKARAERILSAILHNYGLFAVSTIDKFNLRLMRAFSQDMGLSVNFDVEMDAQQLFSESVELLFSELQEENLLTQIMTEIAIENLSDNKRWDISGDMVEQSSKLFQDRFLEQMNALQKVSLKDFNAFRKEVNKKYFTSKKGIQETAESFLNFAKSKGLTHYDFKGKSRGLLNYFNGIANGKYNLFSATLQKQYDTQTYLVSNNIDADILHAEVSSAYQKIQAHLIEFNFWSKIRSKINPITVYNEVEKRLSHVKSENNILLIGEFNKIISENIQDQPAPFIYEKIGNRYHHYFIDEFQDTSNLQWNNLFPLMENAIAEGYKPMIVGDPKQSIYRWRGGNPNLMIELAKKFGAIPLEKNWRSYHEVVQFNNKLYSFISGQLGQEDYRKLYKEATQKENHKKGGFVQLRLEEKPKRGSGVSFLDICMDKLLEDIQQAEKEFSWDEMAILVRKNSEGQKIAEFLSERGYKILSNESLLLKNTKEVQLLLSFIHILSDPSLALYRVAFVRELIRNEVLKLDKPSEFLITIIEASKAEFVQEMAENGVDLTFLQTPFQSFYDQVSAGIRSFGWSEKANAYVSFFMDEILKFQYQPDSSPEAFLQYWEQKKENLSVAVPEGQKAIRLMSIHKSKGLQFSVVFLPHITWSPKASGIWIPTENKQVPEFYIEDFKMPEQLPPEVQALISAEETQAELDALNLLYVATTRAVEQLYITTDIAGKTPKPVSSYLNEFFHLQENKDGNILCFGDFKRCSKKKEEDVSNQEIVPFICGDWTQKVMISKEHQLLWNEERAKAIEYGKKMHAVLEKIDSVEETSNVLETFEMQGFITREEKEIIYQELNDLFFNTELKSIFDSNEFYNERDFVAPNGQLFRPDRLVKVNEKWILLDYKTGEIKNKDKKQVNQYAEDLKTLGFDVAEKYLIYLGSEGVVEVKD